MVRKLYGEKRNTSLQTKNLKPTGKHGSDHMVIWGCMSFKEVGEITFIEGNSNMNVKLFIDILRDNLSNSALKLEITNSYCFLHDNNPKHTAYITRFRKCKKSIANATTFAMPQPENLWHILGMKMRKKKISYKSETNK